MIIIREADKDDAGQIAPLINIIYDEMELDELDDVPDPVWMRVLQRAYQTDAYTGEKATTIVAEDQTTGKVVGVAFGYPDQYEEDLDAIIDRITLKANIFDGDVLDPDLEAFKNEWYLDSIAVDPNYQGQGIGGRLLRSLPEFVHQDGDTIIGLNVDFKNPNAKRLYARHGFKKVGTKRIGDHMYDHMQKPIVTTQPVFA